MTIRRVLVGAVGLIFVSLVIVQLRKLDTPPVVPQANAPARTQSPLGSTPPPSAPTVAPARETLEGQPAMEPPTLAELSTTERPPLGNSLGAPSTPPDAEPKIVLDLLDAYRRGLGAYPAGETNRQLMNALRGANREKLPFIASDHPRLNAKGEIVDAWGTPFFFHQNSRTAIEVRSAGPDKRLYTDDDLVVGKTPSQTKVPTILETPAEPE